ncbi:MAG: hypothetical protein Q8P88_01235 [Candidatus Jorgensenbacteria bacterium]|nr:hypothetical protein [Candidatus Jorgensenbacteria bacterium]
MALEDLERELLSAKEQSKKGTRKPDTRSEATTRERDRAEPRGESESISFRDKMRMVTRSVMLAAGAVLAVSAIVAGALYFFFSREASRGIILTLESPGEVMSGVPFDFVVHAENEIDGIAREAAITVNLPEGIVALGVISGSERVVEETIGDIGGRSVAKKTFLLIAVGDPGTEREIEASIAYTSGGRNRFKTDERARVTIGEPAVKVTTNIPERVIGNSSFEFTVEYENISSFDFTGTTLEVRYPSSFTFQSASLPPDSLNNYWRLGALNGRSKGTLIIKGTIASLGETSVKFPIIVSANFFGKDYPVLETEAEVALAPSPLILSIRVNGSEAYVSKAGELLTYLLRYENRSGVALADMVLRAALAGEMYELGSIGTQGKVDAATHTVTWDATNVPAFRLLDAGAVGEVVLAVPLKSAFPIRRLSDKNFSVKLTLVAESPTVPSYLAASKTSATAILETKLSGLAVVDARAWYRDAASGLVNAGSLPPQVGQPTEYTIHWTLKNYATDVEKVKVRAALPPEVTWTGMVKASGDSVPLFEESSREVVWTIDKIPAAKGIVNAPLEVIFQVRATPTNAQTGNFQTFLFDTSLEAIDMWTGLLLTSRDAALSTRLEDDPTVASDQGRVVP